MRNTLCISLALLLCACGGSGSNKQQPIKTNAYVSAQQYVLDNGFIGSVLVKKGDTTILKNGYGYADKAAKRTNDVDTKYRIASLTKAFTALAVVQLKQQDLIDSFDNPVATYLTDYPNKQITIRQLLTHRSGIPDYLSLVNKNKHYQQSQLIDLFKNKSLEFTPGSQFQYSNSNYFLLGQLIERVSDTSYFDFLNAHILMPLGMENTEMGNSVISGDNYALGYKTSSQSSRADSINMSVPYAAGALSSNLSDYEAWGEAVMSHTLLSDNDIAEVYPQQGYGFGWIVTETKGMKTYTHSGGIDGFSTIIVLVPEVDGMVVAFSNVGNAGLLVNKIAETIAENEF